MPLREFFDCGPRFDIDGEDILKCCLFISQNPQECMETIKSKKKASLVKYVSEEVNAKIDEFSNSRELFEDFDELSERFKELDTIGKVDDHDAD